MFSNYTFSPTISGYPDNSPEFYWELISLMVIESIGVDEFAQSTLRSEHRLEDQKTEKYKKIIDELMRAISDDW